MKKEVSIELKMSELIYDIQNKTYLTGRSADSGENTAHVANMQANDDEENEAQILRSITSAVAILRNKLSEFIDTSLLTSDNDSLTTSENLTFSLKMPSNFNAGVTKTISDAAHQFVVATAIAEWFAITSKGETADYSVAASSALSVLAEALSRRTRPHRK